MSNVPSHSRTRTTHSRSLGAGSVRPSHQHSGYLAPLAGAQELYDEIATEEGQVTGGGIAPGAIFNPGQFAQTIRPVAVVDVLPTLPDAHFPPGSTCTLSSDGKLYRNVADAWSKSVDGVDLLADSVTAAKIAAGAIGTDELAVGARLTGEVANESGATPGVFMDQNGILIRSGKLVLEDEFGRTAMGASGFSGSWEDFVRLGVYNARFVQARVGVIGDGRTADLPYWQVGRGGVPVLTGVATGGVKFVPSAVSEWGWFMADAVPVRAGALVEAGYSVSCVRVAGTLKVDAYVFWYKADGSASSTAWSGLSGIARDASLSAPLWVVTTVVVPADASTGRLRIEVSEEDAHNAGNSITLLGAKVIDQAVAIPPGTRYADSTVVGVDPPAGTVNNYDPGVMDSADVLRFDDGAGSKVTLLTGLAAPMRSNRVIVLFHYYYGLLILKHLNGGSASANMFDLPEGKDLVIPKRGMVTLFYEPVSSKWVVLSTSGIGWRYVPLGSYIDVALGVTTTGDTGVLTSAELTDLPLGTVAVNVTVYCKTDTPSTNTRAWAQDWDGASGVGVLAQAPGAANYQSANSGMVTTGGTNHRQIKYQCVEGGTGTATYSVRVTGYWLNG